MPNNRHSFYNDKQCTYSSAQLHEVGHNLGLAHSGEGDAQYADTSGSMGFTINTENTLSCYNPAKSYQLKWYKDRVEDIDPTSSSSGSGLSSSGKREFQMNGAADYGDGKRDGLIVLRLEQTGGDQK